jgi:predicted transcriptional regulator
MTTLVVQLEDEDAFHDRVRAGLRTVEDGATDEPAERTLSVPDEAALSRVFAPTTLELVRTIAAETPESMRETATLVDRDIKDVSRQLNELAELGLIHLDAAGRAKRPVVPYDAIEVRVPVAPTREGTDDATASAD